MTEFIIEGKAIAKQRPRSSRNGHFYTPKNTKDFEKKVGLCYKAIRGKNLLDKPVSIAITFYEKKPKKCKSVFPIKRTGDIDNKAKCILDALNGIAYNDDCQVVELSLIKSYADKDFTKVLIDERRA
jgi:Holliday junction resolvase RusA-like endonuclease